MFGLSDTIVENASAVKCLMALRSIARRYAASRVAEQVLDVGGERRIGVDIVLELVRGDTEFDRKPEDVDQFLTKCAPRMRSVALSTIIFDHVTVSA
jgi:hypothetical protein